MKIFVISLPCAHARREAVSSQMAAESIQFTYFDALTGKQAIFDQGFGYCSDEFVLHTGRKPTMGEIGCFASHHSLWTRCVELDEPVLILEDDVELLPEFSWAFIRLVRAIEQFGFVRLHTETTAKSYRVADYDSLEMVRYTKAPQGAMAYALSPAAAKKLLACYKFIKAPVDVYMKQFWVHGQCNYGLKPYTASYSVHGLRTHIQGRMKARKNLIVRARRTAHKLKHFVARHHFNFRHKGEGKDRDYPKVGASTIYDQKM